MVPDILPISSILPLWDVILTGQRCVVLFIALAILVNMRPHIMAASPDTCVMMFSNLPHIDVPTCTRVAQSLLNVTPHSITLHAVPPEMGNAEEVEEGGAGARPQVGDTVMVLSASDSATKPTVGKTGRLLEDDNSGRPFKVEFSDGEKWWFKEGELQKQKDRKSNAASKPCSTSGDPSAAIVVSGAGGKCADTVNGTYTQERMHNGNSTVLAN